MRVRAFLCLALLSASCAMAQSSGSLLGVDYTEWTNSNAPAAQAIATDSSGAVYILSTFPNTNPAWVTKLSADGKTMVWQNQLGFQVDAMAVDASGGVYVIPTYQPGDTSVYVAKLNAGGAGLAWKTPIGGFLTTGDTSVLAADSQGRAYVAGPHDAASGTGGIVRLNAAGSALDYTAQVTGAPGSVAVDASGAAFVAGNTGTQGFLARFAPDGSAGFYSTLPQGLYSAALALDANGNPVVLAERADGSGVLLRFDSSGAVSLSATIPSPALGPGFALDAAGNAYIAGSTDQLHTVKNSLATCGWNSDNRVQEFDSASLLTVVAPDGSLLQTTYLPGSAAGGIPQVATGLDSTVFVVSASAETFVPTQAGPFTGGGWSILERLSPNSGAQTFPLACVGNATTYNEGPIAPGEMVTLFGNGLGPLQGIEPQATLESPFPTQLANVEVTFDGTPAPLLWVQDAQINLVVPWSVTPGQFTQICASYNHVSLNCLSWPVIPTAAAVFTVDGVHAAALNQDGTLNSANNPAPAGSIVSIFATGLGPITPVQADGTLVGLPLPSNAYLPVVVEAEWQEPGGLFAQNESFPFVVTYAGPSPYLVAGTSQINFQIVPYLDDGFAFETAIYLLLPNDPYPSQRSQGFQVYVAGQ